MGTGKTSAFVKLLSALLLAALLSLSGCFDPKVGPTDQGPTFFIQQETSSTGTVTNYIQATLDNGTDIYQSIQEGSMTVNGQPMRLAQNSANQPYFYVETPSIEFDTTYTFEVPLKDGTVGSGLIKTQNEGLTTLKVPATASPQTDMPILWNVSNHDQMDITLLFKTTTSEDEVFGTIFRPTAEQMASGKFTIPRVALNLTGATHVRIILRGIKLGSTSNFGNGAEALSVMKIEKVVEFK